MPLPPPAPPRAHTHTPLLISCPCAFWDLALAHCDLCGCAAGAVRRLADAAAAALLALTAHLYQMQSYFELKQQTAHLRPGPAHRSRVFDAALTRSVLPGRHSQKCIDVKRRYFEKPPTFGEDDVTPLTAHL